jgi:putative PIN family toxin of toxin-antitoxin system
MRIVADTNTIVSGLLWQGAPRQVLDRARAGTFDLYTSGALLAELDNVLLRYKFRQRLMLANLTPRDLVSEFAALATIVEPATIDAVIRVDPDDDAVLACAVAAQAEMIVSGDHHLLQLQSYQHILILTATELLERNPI